MKSDSVLDEKLSTDKTGIFIDSSGSQKNGGHTTVKCVEAFLVLYETMTGHKRTVTPADVIEDISVNLPKLFASLGWGGQFLIDGIDRARRLTYSYIRGHTSAIAMTIDPEKSYYGGISLSISLLHDGYGVCRHLCIAGRESSVRALMKATRWEVDDNSDQRWGTGDEIESWTTDLGLRLTKECITAPNYSQVVSRRDSYIVFPWSD